MRIIKVDCCLDCPYLSVYVGEVCKYMACKCMHDLTHGENVKEHVENKTMPNWCPLMEENNE
jgi:hypothetical protein